MSQGPVVRRTDAFTLVGRGTLRALASSKHVDAPVRVMLLAWDGVRRNGHAPFPRGRLAELLGINSRHVGETISRAVDRGLLVPGSFVGCLIVHDDIGTRHPNPEPCPHAERHQAKAAKTPHRAAFRRKQDAAPCGLSTPHRAALDAAPCGPKGPLTSEHASIASMGRSSQTPPSTTSAAWDQDLTPSSSPSTTSAAEDLTARALRNAARAPDRCEVCGHPRGAHGLGTSADCVEWHYPPPGGGVG